MQSCWEWISSHGQTDRTLKISNTSMQQVKLSKKEGGLPTFIVLLNKSAGEKTALMFFFSLSLLQSSFSTSRFGLAPQNPLPAKALEIRSFFHSQGWSYSSGGRSSSWGSRLSLGQFKRSGSESPPFSAGSYGVSYSGSCLKDPSLAPRLPDRISAQNGGIRVLKYYSHKFKICNKATNIENSFQWMMIFAGIFYILFLILQEGNVQPLKWMQAIHC